MKKSNAKYMYMIAQNFLDEVKISSFFIDSLVNKFKEIRSKVFQNCFKNVII